MSCTNRNVKIENIFFYSKMYIYFFCESHSTVQMVRGPMITNLSYISPNYSAAFSLPVLHTSYVLLARYSFNFRCTYAHYRQLTGACSKIWWHVNTELGEPRPEFTAPPLPLLSLEWKWILGIAGFSISSSGAVTSVSRKVESSSSFNL